MDRKAEEMREREKRSEANRSGGSCEEARRAGLKWGFLHVSINEFKLNLAWYTRESDLIPAITIDFRELIRADKLKIDKLLTEKTRSVEA
jgi:hypothetical protein